MFERGFKSWCEITSLQIRKELGLPPADPLAPSRLAGYLDVKLWTPIDINGASAEVLSVLLYNEKYGWSAITVSRNGQDAVIYNPTHSASRQSSDIMHELSHLLMGHRPATVLLISSGAVALRSFDRKQEDEAAWLSGCLLLPRPALVAIRESGTPLQKACAAYHVSEELLTYRLNVTGVNAQVSRRSARGTVS